MADNPETPIPFETAISGYAYACNISASHVVWETLLLLFTSEAQHGCWCTKPHQLMSLA